MRRVLPPAGPPEEAPLWVVLVQDVHGAPSVQRRISGLLDYVRSAAPPDRPLLWVGVEGSAGPFLVRPYRRFSDPERHRAICQYFLRQGIVSGPEHFALTAEREPELRGLENPVLYKAHLDAYRALEPARALLTDLIEAVEAALEPVKERVYGLELWALEKNAAAFESGQQTMTAYVQRLAGNLPESAADFPQLARLLEAARLEESLDFGQVEQARNDLLDRLGRELRGARREELLARTLAYSLGRMTPADYYGVLARLVPAGGGLPRPLDVYERFVAGLQSVDARAFAREVAAAEARAFDRWTKTPAQRDLLAVESDLRVLDRLARQGLDPGGWSAYLARKEEIAAVFDRAAVAASAVGLPVPAAPPASLEAALSDLEGFYRAALARNSAMVSRLLDGAEERPGIAVLVAGEFHIPGIEALLAQQDLPYAVLSTGFGPPAEEKAAPDPFSRSRPLLERLLLGQRLFLNPPGALSVVPPEWGLDHLTQPPQIYGFMDLLLAAAARVPAGEKGAPIDLQAFKDLENHLDSVFGYDLSVDWAAARSGVVELRARLARRGRSRTRLAALISPAGTPEAARRAFKAYMRGTRLSPSRSVVSDMGSLEFQGRSWRLALVAPKPWLPFRWALAQARGVAFATRNFMRLQKRIGWLAGLWMAGGVVISALAGLVSALLVVVWMAVGAVILAAVVLSRDEQPSPLKDWGAAWERFRKKRGAFLPRVSPPDESR